MQTSTPPRSAPPTDAAFPSSAPPGAAPTVDVRPAAACEADIGAPVGPTVPDRRDFLRSVLGVAGGLTAGVGFGIGTSGGMLSGVPVAHAAGKPATTKPATPKAGDWPQWLGPARDGISTEKGLLPAWPREGPKELWRVRGGGGYASISVAGGRAYTLVSRDRAEFLIALDIDKGEEKWATRIDAEFQNGFGNGPRSTPTVEADRVYTTSASGKLYCINADTGAEVWTVDLPAKFQSPRPDWGFAGSPLIEGDLLIVPAGGPGACCLALKKADGSVVWQSGDDKISYSSPVAVTFGGVRMAVLFHAGGLSGLAMKDGKELWRVPWKTDHDCNIATPILLPREQAFFISSGYDRGCALVRVGGTAARWNATIAWENKVLRNHQANSVLLNGTLYGYDGNGPATLKAVDVRSGRMLWQNRSVGKGALATAEGMLYVLGDGGEMALVPASPASYSEKGRFKALEGKCWSAPVLAGGKLYVRNERDIACYKVGR